MFTRCGKKRKCSGEMEAAGSPVGVFPQLQILKELVNSESWVVSSGRKEKKGAGTPPVICKRVRKALMPNESAECSFLKSAEECEIRGVSFWLVLQESVMNGGIRKRITQRR